MAMEVSSSDTIPPWNKILGCATHSRWDDTIPLFPMLNVVVSETRSETSQVFFLNVTLAHLSSYNEKSFNNEDMLYFNDISGNEIQIFCQWAVFFGSQPLPNFLVAHEKGQLWIKLDSSNLSYFSLCKSPNG